MEINISQFFTNAAPMDYSASVAELGQSAGADTWRAANDDSDDFPILQTAEQREAFKAFAQSAGFSESDEFATWSDSALNALAIQWVAGDMRDADLHADMTADDWQAYEARAERGQCNSNIFRADDGRIFWYIGC